MVAGKSTKMQQWLNYRIRVTVGDGRMFVGTFMAFDKYMNLVVSDCEEFRKIKPKGSDDEREVKRLLGFVVVRGENIISMTAEAPPPTERKKAGEGPQAGPGRGQAAGRGVPVAPLTSAPSGLSAPAKGVGAPAPSQMQPKALPPGMPPMMMTPGMVPPGMPQMPPGMPPRPPM